MHSEASVSAIHRLELMSRELQAKSGFVEKARQLIAICEFLSQDPAPFFDCRGVPLVCIFILLRKIPQWQREFRVMHEAHSRTVLGLGLRSLKLDDAREYAAKLHQLQTAFLYWTSEVVRRFSVRGRR